MEGFMLLLFCLPLLNNMAASTARDTISTLQSITDGETIVSAGETFALGFFSPGNSKNRYVGIWYNKIPTTTVVWVANRDRPLTASSGVLKVNDTGILVLLNHNKSVIWSSNTRRSAQDPVAKLLDSGNLIVQDSSNNGPTDFLWQSFDYPFDTLLPGQKFGRNLITGLNRCLTSWNSSDDPSQGEYSYQLDIDGYPQYVLREGMVKRFRFGSWNGIQFSGGPQLKQNAIFRFNFISNEEEVYYVYELVNKSALRRLVLFRFGSWNGIQFSGGPQLKQNAIFRFNFVSNEEEVYYVYELVNKSALHRLVFTTDGIIQRIYWSDKENGWSNFSRLPVDDCDYYAKCGAYASCNTQKFPVRGCLDGFVQKTADLCSDCVRRTSLSCHEDGFLKFSGLKLPDTQRSWFNRNISLEDCRMLCMKNCSCTAYAALDISKGAQVDVFYGLII